MISVIGFDLGGIDVSFDFIKMILPSITGIQ